MDDVGQVEMQLGTFTSTLVACWNLRSYAGERRFLPVTVFGRLSRTETTSCQ